MTSEDFATFWQAYPRRIGKLDAMKAYQKARKIATAEDILSGVVRYAANKPDYADYCHPATFLNKGRWMDEYDTPIPQVGTRTAALARASAAFLGTDIKRLD